MCSQPSIVAEVQTMKLLKHPNILPLYAAFLDDDQLWMVMPYVAGGSASDIMRRTSPNVRRGRTCSALHSGMDCPIVQPHRALHSLRASQHGLPVAQVHPSTVSTPCRG